VYAKKVKGEWGGICKRVAHHEPELSKPNLAPGSSGWGNIGGSRMAWEGEGTHGLGISLLQRW